MIWANYFKIALRTVRKQPWYSGINVLGLTFGISACLFILLFISNELKYDSYHHDVDRIYRISSDVTEPDDAFLWATTQSPLGPQLKSDFPEVEEAVRYLPTGETRFQSGSDYFFEDNVYLVDSNFASVLTYSFISGDAEKALNEPNTIVLSASTSNRIFGHSAPLGAILTTESGTDYKVTGVYRDVPAYTHLQPNAMISTLTNARIMNPSPGSWGSFNFHTYVKLKEGTDPKEFHEKLSDIITTYVAVIFDQFNIKIKYDLVPVESIHLYSRYEGEQTPAGDISFLYIFGVVAFFLLLIACINYMNLSTARATKRGLEVGVRKVLGSNRKMLINQFLSESLLFSGIAILLSFLITLGLLPVFNNAFELSISRTELFTPMVIAGLLMILIITGVAGGSYPAFYLSSFRPVDVIKGSLAKGAGNPQLRKTLVIVQFTITLFMLVGTGVIYDQMNYLRTKDLGFDKDHVMTISLRGQEAEGKYPVLRERLLQDSRILSVGSATSTPGQGFSKSVMKVENSSGQLSDYGVDNFFVDYDFFPTMGIEIVHGRNFDLAHSTDSSLAIIVNQSMVDRMAWQDPIGRKIQLDAIDTLPSSLVIGVVKDFHQKSLYEPIAPMIFIPRFNNQEVQVKMQPKSVKDLSSILSHTQKSWNEVFPGLPFQYEFVDAAFMEQYRADEIRARVFSIFSSLMIFISCLGLLGLASFTAEQRSREIGIRKILGADNSNIVFLLTKNFIVLVSIGSIPAFIAAYYFMQKWLETFYYHTAINFWIFALALVLVIAITLLTTGFHALKAAVGNPVEALRQE